MKNARPKSNYLALNRRLDLKSHLVATFRIESKLPLKEIAQIVAGESSIGTWTEVGTLSESVFKRLSAKVIGLNTKKNLARIAYPIELFEPGNIPQLLSSVAGNIFSMKVVSKLRLVDLDLPLVYINSFAGPAFGIAGVRRKIKIPGRPLIGAIMKPKIGLSWRAHARFAYLCFKGGADLVKDDENLTDLKFNPFTNRVRETLRLARWAERETGEMKICAFNITAPADEMIRRAKYIKSQGGNCAMVDIMTIGFSGLQALRQAKLGLILHGHRAMHSAITRDPERGISMLVIAKLARLAGIDQLHTGTVVGKMAGSVEETVAINSFLKKPWGRIKKVMPIASGGLHPGLIARLYKITGPDVIVNFGGGIHGHPNGTLAGAQAVKEAVLAAVKGTPINKQAEDSPVLKAALKHWK
ncbi:MAG: ribulose-bisphosphate carboxylase large subunit [Patescibacteria group bacterium]|nr:ribulose-bisphosphate carboxylase large subunit [Patescibacteria group bacterium]